jgi:hypothetical protein
VVLALAGSSSSTPRPTPSVSMARLLPSQRDVAADQRRALHGLQLQHLRAQRLDRR